jgi:hypothetical protein
LITMPPRETSVTPIMRRLAVLLSTSNLSTNTACSKTLHQLLFAAFDLGFSHGQSTIHQRMGSAKAFESLHKRATSERIMKALREEDLRVRNELISIFTQCKYVGLSIDGVTVKTRHFLNYDVVSPIDHPHRYFYLPKYLPLIRSRENKSLRYLYRDPSNAETGKCNST